MMIQFSNGRAQFFIGKGVSKEKQLGPILGGIAGAHYVDQAAKAYGVPVISNLEFQRSSHRNYSQRSQSSRRDLRSGMPREHRTKIEGIKFKHLRITRAPRGFSFVWQQSEVTEALTTGIPDVKKGVELLLIDPKIPLVTKALIEFTLLADENN
jgi:hypothetical protein